MWVVLAFVSALCLGFYDISKKVALRDNGVADVLTLSVLISSAILTIPLLLSRICPDLMAETPFYVPHLNAQAHLLTFVKSCIVLSSWIFAYISLKHLPISVVNPWQATRPMWTLVGAMLIFGERLNLWQWIGILLAIGTIFAFSFHPKKVLAQQHSPLARYYIALALAILIGSCSGLYDKYMMRHYDHNAVQVYYTFYQGILMLGVWTIYHHRQSKSDGRVFSFSYGNILPIALISIFLVISDNVYMLALRDPDSLIAVVSTIRRGGAVIGFAYGLIFLKEQDPWKKVLSMLGILAGLICLTIGTL
jgi:transporter family protein